MKIDTKKIGFVITYFQHSDDGYNILVDNIKKLSKENYYLVLASHSPVDRDIQEMCDYYVYQQKNIVDDRKYSHGVAESNLIEFSFNHLKEQGIEWTYKICYDILITDISRFNDWVNDFKYPFVSCNWGHNVICTHSFFANLDFVLNNIDFYQNVESMFAINNVLENCWEKNLRDKDLLSQTFAYENKQVFYGDNVLDVLGYDYVNIDFTFSPEEGKFYVTNNSLELENVHLRIFDYHTDLCIYLAKDFTFNKGVSWWIVPPHNYNMSKSKNGFYLEVYLNDRTIRKNIMVKDFDWKHPMSKKFKTYKMEEVKFNEFCDFDEFSMYNEFEINLDEINNFVDIGANYAMLSTPFLMRNKKVYLIDADTYNISLLNKNFGSNKKVKIIDKAIYSHDGTIDFWEEPGCSVISSIDPISVNGTTDRIKKTIECITPNTLITDYIDEESIDMMKIDIEGAEYPLFKSISEESMSKIKKFLIEFHLNDDYRVMDIVEKLAFNGFRFKFLRWNRFDDNNYVVENIMGIIYAWK